MTAPNIIKAAASTTRILSGDEWEASMYAPHRTPDDPAKPMGAGRILTGEEWEKAHRGSLATLKLPAMPKFVGDATRRLDPNAGSVDRSIPEQLGGKVRDIAAGFDAAAIGLDPTLAGSARLAAILGRQVVAPAVEHPLLTLALANPVGAVVGTGMAAHTVAAYGWQRAHELGMSPEERAQAEADPNRISGEAAAVQAVMLGLGGLAGVRGITKATDFGAGMMEAGAEGVKPLYFETPRGAEVLGTMAAQRGLPETASPYPTATPLDVAWKEGHAVTAAPEAAAIEPGGPPRAAAGGPSYKGPASLYGRLSDDALAAEYRTLIEKRAAEEPSAVAPLWDAEREARAVEQIENRRRADGSLAPADKRRLSYLQATQGEGYGEGRHTFASATAERRLKETNKHIAAIEKEIANRGLDAAELMQQPSTGGGGLTSVEGTGELRTRGLARNVEQRAVANELTDYLGDLPEYRRINMADQAAKATQLLADDPILARHVALGDESPPRGLLPESVFKVVEKRAIEEGDVATLRDLASGGLTEQATTMGQRLRALAERDPDSPVVAIQKISDLRGGAKHAEQAITDTVAELTTHLDEARAIDVPEWVDFLETIRC